MFLWFPLNFLVWRDQSVRWLKSGVLNSTFCSGTTLFRSTWNSARNLEFAAAGSKSCGIMRFNKIKNLWSSQWYGSGLTSWASRARRSNCGTTKIVNTPPHNYTGGTCRTVRCWRVENTESRTGSHPLDCFEPELQTGIAVGFRPSEEQWHDPLLLFQSIFQWCQTLSDRYLGSHGSGGTRSCQVLHYKQWNVWVGCFKQCFE